MNPTADARTAILKALAAAPDPSPQLCERIAARMAGPLLESLAPPSLTNRPTRITALAVRQPIALQHTSEGII